MARVSVLFITVVAVMTTFVSIVTQCFAIVLVVMILMIVLIPKCCGSGEGVGSGALGWGLRCSFRGFGCMRFRDCSALRMIGQRGVYVHHRENLGAILTF